MPSIEAKYNCLKGFGFPKDIDYCNGKLDLKQSYYHNRQYLF